MPVKEKMLSLRIDPLLFRCIKDEAVRLGLSSSEFVRQLALQYLIENQKILGIDKSRREVFTYKLQQG